MIEEATALRNDGRFEVFYDGDCPLCRREIRFLQKKDRRNAIEYTDIASPDFDATEVGVDRETLMARIHGRRPDGQLVTGVDVFRELYSAIGWRKLVAVTRWPILRNVLDVGYVAFAKLRPYLPGRHGSADDCSTGTCSVPRPATAAEQREDEPSPRTKK